MNLLIPDKKTANEIIKALKCCIEFDCKKCSYDYWDCGDKMLADTLDLINRQKEEYDHLLKIARKMHTWIFLNIGDEQATYDEIGLSDEDNILLGYMGEIELVNEEIK